MFYFTVGEAWNLEAVIYLVVMTVGNAIGGVFLPLMRRFAAKTGA